MDFPVTLKRQVKVGLGTVRNWLDFEEDDEFDNERILKMPSALHKALDKYVDECVKDDSKVKDLVIETELFDRDGLSFLMTKTGIAQADRVAIAQYLYPDPSLAACENLTDFYLAMAAQCYVAGVRPSAEIFICGVWEPCQFSIDLTKSIFFGDFAKIDIKLDICGAQTQNGFSVSSRATNDLFNNKKTTTVSKILSDFSVSIPFRLLTMDDDAFLKWRDACQEAKRIGLATKVVSFVGQGILINNYDNKFYPTLVSGKPVQAIIDCYSERSGGSEFEAVEMTSTVVKFFNFNDKEWYYAPLSAMKEYQWVEDPLNKIILPESIKDLVKRVFNASTSGIFGDVISSKGGGIVIQAYGPTGIGKTLTAEMFAQHAKRPLYSMTLAELSMNPSHLENNLGTVFDRASRWDAILLFDEADILLGKRDSEELARSAIVGVFLRTMDYFHGVIFMTTNRHEVLDDAIDSRVAIKIPYPELDEDARSKVWDLMIKQSKFKVEGDRTELHKITANGRIISSTIRVMQCLYPEGCSTGDLAKFLNYRMSLSPKKAKVVKALPRPTKRKKELVK